MVMENGNKYIAWEYAFMMLKVKNLIHAFIFQLHSGGRLNKKDGLTRYGDSHVKDKTS